MKTRFLFPYKFRIPGYCLLVFGLLLLAERNLFKTEFAVWNVEYHHLGNTYDPEIIVNDILLLTLITGLLLIGFTKEKIEDEQISQLRLDSLQWAIYLNYIILVICTICFNGLDFFGVMVYNMFTPLLFFIVRFRLKVIMNNRLLNKEITS